jgi:hypothetical protein
MYLDVVEEYPEYRGKLVRAFAKCLGIKFDYILFVIVKDEEKDNAKGND